MEKKFISVILFLAAKFVFAQQDPQFTQNMLLKLPVNPGYAGTSGSICGTMAYRTQWLNFPGAPKTFLFTGDMPVEALNGGVGLTVMKDKLGNFNFTMSRVAYSYHRVINGGKGLLGVGLEFGALQSSVEYNWIAPDGTNGSTDQAIPSAAIRKTTYDLGAGAYYTDPRLHIGFSVSHVPGNAENLTATHFDYKLARHYYVMAGYDFPFHKITLRPSLFVKSDNAVTVFDFNCNILYNNFFWCGLSYRLQDAIAPMMGVIVNATSTSIIKIGYSYDWGVSDLRSYHNNTHEILINYCMKLIKEKIPTSHKNPRNL